MRTVLRFLFPAKSCSAKASGILLASRMIFGGLLFSHGIAKWSNFDTMSTMFPAPLGIGSSASLSLAIFGEVPFAVKELALVYLAIFVLMYIAGPGNYSVDRLIAKKIGGGK